MLDPRVADPGGVPPRVGQQDLGKAVRYADFNQASLLDSD